MLHPKSLLTPPRRSRITQASDSCALANNIRGGAYPVSPSVLGLKVAKYKTALQRDDSARAPGYICLMGTPISSIRNLGPAMEDACAKAGIHSAEELRALGSDETYARLLQTGVKPHFIGYYVLVMALQGRPWNDCKGKEKEALRKRFDALKAGNKIQPDTEFERMMDLIGVREK